MKKLTRETKLVILGATLVLVVPGVSGIVLTRIGLSVFDAETRELSKTEEAPPIVTLAEFEQLREGMSRREVEAIVGDPGVAEAPKEGGDGQPSVSVWRNSDASYMHATFEDGHLVAKAQLYLK